MLHGAGGTGGLPPCPCLHPVVDTFLFYANLSFSYAVPLFFLCSMAQVGRGVSRHLHVSILLSTRFFFMLICPFLLLSPSFSYAPWRRWEGGSPSISMSPSCLSTRFFFMLICPFLMLPPSFSYAPWRRWDGGSPSISMSPSCCRHVSFFYASLSFSSAVPLFFLCSMAQVGRGVSLHLHVSILLSTRFFFMLVCPFLLLSPSFSYAPWRRWDGGSPSISISPSCLSTRFFFYANLSFSYAVPLFFLCSTVHVGRAPLYKTRPFLVLSFMRSWLFLCCVCPFLMLHGALSIHLHVSPSISMSPSCCRHVCFLMPTGLSLMRAVFPFMPSVFFCESVLFLCCPLFFLCSTARVGRGEGHPFTRPDLFWCYPLCGAGFCLCCVCLFLMLHGALSIHLHVSASISMSPILLSTFFSRTANLTFFYAAPVLLVLHGPRDGEGEGMGLISWARPCFMAFTRTRSFFYADSLLCILHLSASRPCCDGTTSSITSSTTHQQQHQPAPAPAPAPTPTPTPAAPAAAVAPPPQHQHQHQHQHQ